MSMWNSEDIEFMCWTALGVGVLAGGAIGMWESGREYGRREQYKLMLDKLNQKETTNGR